MILALLTVAWLSVASVAYAQQPTNCAVGGFVISPDETIWVCKGVGQAPVQISTGGGSSVPAGSIVFIDSGTCAAGWAEVPALNGKTIIGTLAANGNVGTTGGSDTITPGGTNSVPTFTGTVGTLAVTAHTSVASKQGASAGNVITTGTHTITGIPGGSVTAPTFTGAQADNRSAFTRLIACRKS